MANTFYIVRHGQTNWNILGKTQGHGNSDLTEKGIEQATELADSLSKKHRIILFVITTIAAVSLIASSVLPLFFQ